MYYFFAPAIISALGILFLQLKEQFVTKTYPSMLVQIQMELLYRQFQREANAFMETYHVEETQSV